MQITGHNRYFDKTMTHIRLQKFLSQAGVCSRRKGETHIVDGLVTVNGKTVTELGAKVDPEKDTIRFRGKVVKAGLKPVYIMVHKPKGYVTSCSQPGDKTILDLVDLSQRLFPVGRLDKASTGLLLLTNDGRIHHRISHPSFDHEKEYDVRVSKTIVDGALRHLEKGVSMMGVKTRPAVIRRLGGDRFRIILKEGKNRQIRRMVRKVGNAVVDLKRVRVARLKLGKLKPGTWRHLSENEVRGLLTELGLKPVSVI